MKKYRVDTGYWSSAEYTDIEKAEYKYERTKEDDMSEGVSDDSYVELQCSEEDFEDYITLKRAIVVVDENRMAISTPQDEGYEWDYWAKWQEC